MMHKYTLFGEWRGRGLWGATLTDAVIRAKTLQRPDEYANGAKVADGETVTIKHVIGERDTSNSTRGCKPYTSVVAELDDGAIVEIDATLTATI